MIESLIGLACADNVLANHNKTLVKSRVYQPAMLRCMPEKKLSPPHRQNGRPRRRADWRRRRRAINSELSAWQKTVAVVDGDPEIRRAMAKLLPAFGFAAETFDTVTAFLHAVASSKAACLVIDIQITGTSVAELAHRLAEGGCKCPIVFTTALDDGRIRSEALAAGGVACLRKPFPADLLIETIIKAIG